MFYTATHEWIRPESSHEVTVGLTKKALEEMGEVVYAELPQLGKQVRAGEELVILESTKAAADVYSPVAGEIVSVNSALSASTALLNEDPERSGWVCKIRLEKPLEQEQFLTYAAYQDLIQ